jgi:hypothetical protein|eukprot:COSAG03_NODE_38_length_17530_cov_148.572223_3_plen_87_part_00
MASRTQAPAATAHSPPAGVGVSSFPPCDTACDAACDTAIVPRRRHTARPHLRRLRERLGNAAESETLTLRVSLFEFMTFSALFRPT